MDSLDSSGLKQIISEIIVGYPKQEINIKKIKATENIISYNTYK